MLVALLLTLALVRPHAPVPAQDSVAAAQAQLQQADLASLRGDARWIRTLPGPPRGAAALVEDVVVLHELVGENANDQFGWITRKVGDLHRDGVRDFASTAPSWPGNGSWRGRVYVYSGATSKLIASFTSQSAGDTLGFDATGLGAVNGDGYADYLLSSAWSAVRGPQTGRVFVIAGHEHTNDR